MILQELRLLSLAAGWADSAGFAEKAVHFLLVLDSRGNPVRSADGRLECWFPLTTPKGQKGAMALGKSYADRPETLRRNQSYIAADCFVGRADRLVLGGPPEALRCRDETQKLANQYAAAVPEVEPVCAFYQSMTTQPGLADELRQSLIESLVPFQPKAKPGRPAKLKLPEEQEVAFCLAHANYRPVFELSAVESMWRLRSVHSSATTKIQTAVCLCCGTACDPEPIHKRVIKGLPGRGGKGVALMSYNKDSSQSHGLEDCLNAPMCSACVDSYTISLNNLLKNKPPKGGGPLYGGSEKLAGLAFVYWLREPTAARPIARLIHGVQHVERQLESVQVGTASPLVHRTNRFFLAVMSAPTLGRAVLHDWIDEALEEVDGNLARWFADTQVIDRFTGELSQPVRFAEPGKGVKGRDWAAVMDRHLPSALGREIKDRDKIRDRGMKWDVQKDVVLAIFERALLGRTMPLSIMHCALERLREGMNDSKEKKRSALPGFTTARLGLMRAVLNDHPELLWERRPIMPGLDRDRGDPAYVCGRLLAILSRVQAKAMAGRDADGEKEQRLCANVVSRYYGAASSRPATGLFMPLRMRVHHLTKLDRDDPEEAKYRRIDLQDALRWITPPGSPEPERNLPRTLSPAQQCVFALGFEHQMAEFFKSRRAKNGTDTGTQPDNCEPSTSEGSK